MNTDGTLSGSNVAIYQGTSSSVASKFLANPAGGFFVLFLRDTPDNNGYYSSFSNYQNDLTTKIASTDYRKSIIYERDVSFFQSGRYLLANSEIWATMPITIYFNFISITFFTYDPNNNNLLRLSFGSATYLTDIKTKMLVNGKALVIMSILDNTYHSFFLSAKVFVLSIDSTINWNSGNFIIDTAALSYGAMNILTQLEIERSSGNVIIVYLSTGENILTNKAVKYAVLDSVGCLNLIKAARD